jgi:hypothetical protein
MSSVWKLVCASPSIDAEFEDLDITGASVSLGSCDVDRLTLEVEPDNGIMAAVLIPFNAQCQITRDDEPFFSGVCRTNPRQGTNPQEIVRYEILGPWFDLQRLTFQQRWKIWDAATETATWQRKSRIILGQAEDGSAMTVGEIIAEVLDYAVDCGANLDVPADTTGWPSVKIPWEEISNLTCADVIIRCLSFVPDWKCRFDYSEDPPVFELVNRTSATAMTLTIGTSDITEISIAARNDLACPGVRVIFERTHEFDGSSFESIEAQVAGDPDDLDAISITLPLAGMNVTTQSVRILSEALPATGSPPTVTVNWLDKPWWIAQVPSLGKIVAEELTLKSCTQTVHPAEEGGSAEDIEDLPRVLMEGNIPGWLGGAIAARVTLDLTYSYIVRERDADNKIVEKIKDEVISHQLTLTNVPDGTYTRSGVDYAEPAPVGFAAALYASWHPLQYDGTISIEAVEVEHLAIPGDVLNIASGLSAWATMAAHIQQVQYNIASGHTSYVIGPAKRIDPDTLLSLMRRVRARMLPLNHICRVSGLATDRGNMIEQGGLGPDKQTSTSAGQRTYLNISPGYDPGATFNKEIELDPDAIVPSDAATRTESIVIKPRIIQTIERDGDELVRVQRAYLVSDPVSDAVVIDPDEPGGGGPENPGDEDCDQNTHPGDNDYDTAITGGDDRHPGDNDAGTGDHPGGGAADEDDTNHPGSQDCYTTT